MPSLLAPFERVPGHRYFRLVVLLDESQIPDDHTLGRFASNALRAGARSVLSAGSAAERVHDLFDEQIVWEEIVDKLCDPDQGEFIVTTWHTNESLARVLWEACFLGIGCDAFEEENPCILVVVQQGDPRLATLRELASDLPRMLDAIERED